MDNILASLGPEQIVVDLGCGGGSFNYSAYRCRILGIDPALGNRKLYVDSGRISYVEANSDCIPLTTASVDAIVCNHSLEHIAAYTTTLAEMRRILKPRGLVWISIPNGFGFDDGLYRLLYAGGGHVNRFRFEELKNSVESATRLTLLQSTLLVSGFVYCRRPPQTVWPYLPRRLKLLHSFPIVSGLIPFFLNGASRILDKALKTRLSIYGWGFVFGLPETVLVPLHSYFNVCSACGCGNDFQMLRTTAYMKWGVKLYRCPQCNQSNLLFSPPPGFD